MTPLESICTEAFPSYVPALTDDDSYCLVQEVLEGRSNDRWDDAITSVVRHGGSDRLVVRLREEHPPSKKHKPEFDVGLTAAFAEAEAFAWAAEVAALGLPAFLTRQDTKTPDLVLPGWGWIEAKSIWPSKSDSERDRREWKAARARGAKWPSGTGTPRAADHGFYAKFQSAGLNAVEKWQAQGGSRAGKFGVFFHLLNLDVDVFDDNIWPRLAEWATRFASEQDVRIVICYNFIWKAPRLDIG